MLTFAKRGAAVLTAVALMAVLATPAAAQRGFPSVQQLNPVVTNPYIMPGMQLKQWAYNTNVVGRTYGQFPPWMYGYNPYTPSVVGGNFGGYGGYGGYGGGGYGGLGPYDPYNGFYSLGTLYGEAAVMNSYGQLGISSEQTRILREVAIQAKLDTKKKMIDLMAYERANTPTYTDNAKRNLKISQDRALNAPTLGEIMAGSSQNLLADDLGKKTMARGPKLHPIPLNEKLLQHVNVRGGKSHGNIGLLRTKGQFDWPTALRELTTVKQRDDIAADAREAYRLAAKKTPPDNLVISMKSDIDTLREKLLKRANDLPTQQYLAAKRFLNEFDDALVAIQSGDVPRNIEFHKEFAGEGKNVQDLVSYMSANGLRFAPAGSGDEDAYHALQTLLAAYTMALNSQVAVVKEQ